MTQLPTPESRVADTLAHHGIYEFIDAEGTPSILVAQREQGKPVDGFEDPTGEHLYIAGEIMWEGVEIYEHTLVHSLMISEYNTPSDFAVAVSGLIRKILS